MGWSVRRGGYGTGAQLIRVRSTWRILFVIMRVINDSHWEISLAAIATGVLITIMHTITVIATITAIHMITVTALTTLVVTLTLLPMITGMAHPLAPAPS